MPRSRVAPRSLRTKDANLDATPIGSQTLASALVDRLRIDIVSGFLLPGSKLRIRELTERYDTSVNPLREALARLAATGLVIVEDQRGFRVAPISARDFEDLTRVKRHIYAIALCESIERGDVAWESRVLAAHHRLAAVTPGSNDSDVDEVAFEKYHGEFHRTLIDACDSAWLIHFHEVLYEQSSRYRRFVAPVATGWTKLRSEHEALMKAVLARNADRAIMLFNKHLATKPQQLLALPSLRLPDSSFDSAGRSATPAGRRKSATGAKNVNPSRSGGARRKVKA